MNLATLDIYLGDEVLDVGSGNQPTPMSTVLLDLYLRDDSHRSEHPLKLDERPFINASVEYLPFKDKAFDYVIASHVLEHVDDPVRACKEIQRVGKRGYVECPSPFLEQGYWVATDGKSHWEKHKWYCWNPSQSVRAAEKREISRKLIFQRKNPKDFDDDSRFGHVIRLMLQDIRAHFSKDGTDNERVNWIMGQFTPSLHATILHWEGNFEVEVRECEGGLDR